MSPEDFGTLANLVLAVIIIAVIGVRFLRMQKQTKDHPNYQAAKAKEESAKEKKKTISPSAADQKTPSRPVSLYDAFPDEKKTPVLGRTVRKKKWFSGEQREVDCDLDERIWGPKDQNKDIF